MIRLMVSYNLGVTYGFDCEANSVEELKPRMKELDEAVLRWYAEDESGERQSPACAIHTNLFEFIKMLNTNK